MNRIINSIINEASLSRVHQHSQGRNIGIISAMRGERSHEENETAHRELAGHIRKAGYGYVKVHSGFEENKGTPQARKVLEKSYLVIGKKGHDNDHLVNHLKKWGKQYDQDAVLHKTHDQEEASLHSLKPENKEIYHGPVGKWHPNRAGEFSSYLHKYRSDKNFEFGGPNNKPSAAKKGSFKDLKESVDLSISREVKFVIEPSFFTRMGYGPNWQDHEFEF